MDKAIKDKLAKMREDSKKLRGNWWRFNAESAGEERFGVVTAMAHRESKMTNDAGEKQQQLVVTMEPPEGEEFKFSCPKSLETRLTNLKVKVGDVLRIQYQGKQQHPENAAKSYHGFFVDTEATLADRVEAEKE